LLLDDPANLYGCASGCSCTGDEAPVDLRSYLAPTLGTVSTNGADFEVSGQEVRFFGVNYLNRFTHPDLTDPDVLHRGQMLATRLSILGHNLVRLHHVDNPTNFFSSGTNTPSSTQLANFVSNVELLQDANLGVDLNLHTRRGLRADTTSTTSLDGDGVLTEDEASCSEDNKLLAYVSEDVRALLRSFAETLLGQTLSSGESLSANQALQLIEITNENSLLDAYQAGHLEGLGCQLGGNNLSAYWAGILEAEFQGWLAYRYPDLSTVAVAWSPDGTGATYQLIGGDTLGSANGGFEEFFPEFTGIWSDTATCNNTSCVERVFRNWGMAITDVTADCAGGGTALDNSFTMAVACDTLGTDNLCTSDRAISLSLSRSATAGCSVAETFRHTDFSLTFKGFAHHLTSCTTSSCEHDASCSDGVDNDSDGVLDASDPDCSGQRRIIQERNCTNSSDDDADGQTDSLDPDCYADGDCSDGLDGDADGAMDANDPDCAAGQSWEDPTGDGSGYTYENYMPILYNGDANLDGSIDTAEALVLGAGQPYTLSLEYKVSSYADEAGGTDCMPLVRARVKDTEGSLYFSSGTYPLNVDSSAWHTVDLCIAPDAAVNRASIVLDLGSDCQSETILVRQVLLQESSVHGLQEDETQFSEIGLRPFSEAACLSSHRYHDTVRFLTDRQAHHYHEMRSVIRNQGYLGPIENSNCAYNLPHLASLKAALVGSDPFFTDGHAYWDQNHGDVSIGATDYTCYHADSLVSAYSDGAAITQEIAHTSTALHSEDSGDEYNPLLLLAHGAQSDIPYIASEHAYTYGNPYQAESLFLTTTFASFQNWSGYVWLGYNRWTNPFDIMDSYEVGAESEFMTLENPAGVATMPLAALMMRNDYANGSESTPLTLSHTDVSAEDSLLDDTASLHVAGIPSAMALIHPVRTR
jgi:hypothetical protein